MCEERGFLPSVPTEGRTLPKWAPEVGTRRSYQLGPPRLIWTANAAATATKNPVCKCRSLSTAPLEPVQPATARVPRSRDSFPGRTHGMGVSTSRRPLPPQARPAFQLWLPYPSLPPAWMSKRALISRCFNPILSGWGTDSWGQPTHRGGAKAKAKPQELCEQRREREIFLWSLRSSGLNPHNQLDKPCICGIPE